MLEYLDSTHLPFVDSNEPFYSYCRTVPNRKIFIDGRLVYEEHEIIADCRSFKPIALEWRHFPLDWNWGTYALCLLGDNGRQYKLVCQDNDEEENTGTWVVLDETLDLDDYLLVGPKDTPQIL